MHDHRYLPGPCIADRLGERCIKIQPLGTLALDVQAWNIRNHIRRIGTAMELHSTPGIAPEQACQFHRKFPFTRLTLVQRVNHSSFHLPSAVPGRLVFRVPLPEKIVERPGMIAPNEMPDNIQNVGGI